MKKIIILLCMFLLVTGCGRADKDDVIKKFQNKINNNYAYILKGNMSINSNEDVFEYNITASKSKEDYYRVSLVNKTNDHEQVILKNKDAVYVVTPDLNKSFKFQSDWPNNGSQSYLLDVLVNDVVNDDEAYVTNFEDGYYIQCHVNYPNNDILKTEKIYLSDKYEVKKVEVLDDDGNVKITLTVNSIDYKPKFDKKYFLLETLVSEDEIDNTTTTQAKATKSVTQTTTQATTNNETTTTNPVENSNSECTGDNCKNECTGENCEKETGNVLDDIIYPLYVPTNTFLSTEDTISTDNGDRAILTFAGDNPFILVEEASQIFDELEIIPVNGEPLMLSDSIGAISANSLYWTSNGIDYYISSTSLSGNELMTIAEGLTGSSVIVSAEK